MSSENGRPEYNIRRGINTVITLGGLGEDLERRELRLNKVGVNSIDLRPKRKEKKVKTMTQ